MVSLPDIFQSPKHSVPSKRSSNTTTRSLTLSALFCNDCSNELDLPLRVDPEILRQYEEKCAQIRYMERILGQNRPSFDSEVGSFQLSTSSKESLQIYAFGFPLIQKSSLIPPPKTKKDEFDWNKLNEKSLKRQSRCNILHKTHQHQSNRAQVTRQQNKNLRKLTPIKYSKSKHPSQELQKVKCQKLLQADPEVIVFEDMEIGHCYKEKCKITNISSGKCKFFIHSMDRNSQFKLEWNTMINTLAAGLSIYVTVEFNCRSVEDITEEFLVTTQNGQDLVVSIQAVSDPPHLIEINDCKWNVDEIVDSYVDSGSLFVGEKGITTLTLKNIGHRGRFFIISEANWADREYDIDSSNTLVVYPFTVTPMYFSLKEGQEITLSISVTAPAAGLHTVRLFVLCDNNSLNYIDLISDGFLYDPSMIVRLELSKTFDVDKSDIEYADGYFDLGKVLINDSTFSCFFLYNSVSLNISYHWKFKEVSIPGTKPLPLYALSILPKNGRLKPHSIEMFCLKLDTTSVDPGVYRILLVLVVDDLPKKCIPFELLESKKCVTNYDGEEELQSIETEYIEVWMECVSPTLSLFPHIVDFTEFPLVCGSPREIRQIIINNDSPGSLPVEWKCYEESPFIKLKIEPCYLQCEEYSSNICTLTVDAIEEGPFNIVFWCVSEKVEVKLRLLIQGYCIKPHLTPITDSVDFGLVKKGASQTAKLIAKNCSQLDSFQWTLDELQFGPSENDLIEVSEGISSLSTNEGEFCHRNSQVLAHYHLSCQEDMLWCSALNWDGQYIPVTADVQALEVSFSTHTLKVDQLSLEVQAKFRLTVSNLTNLNTAICWGNPTEDVSEIISVDVVPRCVMLQPTEKLETDVYLTPHTVGPLRNLYIPCFVEGHQQPLLLKVEGTVEGLRVRVEWESATRHCCIFWPPPEQSSCEEIEEQTSSKLSLGCPCPPISASSSTSATLTNCYDMEIKSYFSNSLSIHLTSTPFQESNADITDISEEINDEGDDNISQASSIPYLNWPIVGGRYTRDLMSEEWEEHFRNLFILEELGQEIEESDFTGPSFDYDHGLCFHNIPVQKAISQNIYIRNETPITSSYEASVVYNFERVQEENKIPDPEKILKKLRQNLILDTWLERANKNWGLTVFVEPAEGQLLPEDYVILTVTVVAHSWGSYHDTIIVRIGDLNDICIPLSVTVEQSPVTHQQLIRFGSVSLRSSPVTRFMTVENTSSVPVYVCWEVLSQSSEILPFNVILFDDDPFQLRITPYYGSYSSSFFEISERYTFLEPYASKTIKVIFNPKCARCDIKTDKGFSVTPRATLIGHIYLTGNARHAMSAENCVRLDGFKLDPLKIVLEGHVEIPLLSLVNVYSDDLIFKCSAYDAMSAKSKIWREEKVLTLKNDSSISLKAKMSTTGLFYVSKIEYPCAENKNKHSKNVIFLQPGETCELTVVCEVSEETFSDAFEEDNEFSDSTIQMGCAEYGFISFKNEDIRQEIKLELWLYQPLLQFSEGTLNFGLVYLEETKILTVDIKAPFGKESFTAFLLGGGQGVFSLNSSSGTVDPRMAFMLHVSFCPRACITYKDVLVIRPCTEKIMSTNIPITGVGTFNYRAHVY